jgi:hypothetical protein
MRLLRFICIISFVLTLSFAWACFALAPEATEPDQNEPEPATRTASSEPSQPQDAGLLEGDTPAQRAQALVRFVASIKPSLKDQDYPKASAPAYAARLLEGTDVAYAQQRLDAAATSRLALAADHRLDPFDKIALVHTFFLCRKNIPATTADKIRQYVSLWADKVWKGYGAMNYRLMEDGSGFLAAEEWPDLVDADHLDAQQIKAATKARLMEYFDDITLHNFHEYGSPIYLGVDLSAMRMLAEFARDDEVREHARLTLDAMLLDVACTWNQGYNAGTAGRAKYWISTITSPQTMESTATSAWIWFGGPRPISGSGAGWVEGFWMAAPGSYRLPEIIQKLSQQRDHPSVFRETVSGMEREQVHRITYHSPHYSLASQWDHCPAPTDALYKESRRNLLKWVSDKPDSTFAVCMDNPRRPYALKENVANKLGYGENPFSEYLQSEGTLIGVYRVPDDYPYYKMYVPFPRNGSIVKRIEREGWVLCHNGNMLLAFHSVKPCAWKKPWDDNDMLWCDQRSNGWIEETAELSAYAGGGVDAELARFGDDLLRRTQVTFDESDTANPRLIYRSLGGHRLVLQWIAHKTPYTGQSKIDDRSVDYPHWPRLESPWVSQALGSSVLRITIGDQRLEYDFARWTRKEN